MAGSGCGVPWAVSTPTVSIETPDQCRADCYTSRMDLQQQFGRILTAAREKRGISRRALAREVDVSDVTLMKYEHGKNLTLEQMRKVCDWYDVQVDLSARSES